MVNLKQFILVLAWAQAYQLVFEFPHYHSFLTLVNVELQNADKCI